MESCSNAPLFSVALLRKQPLTLSLAPEAVEAICEALGGNLSRVRRAALDALTNHLETADLRAIARALRGTLLTLSSNLSHLLFRKSDFLWSTLGLLTCTLGLLSFSFPSFSFRALAF